MRSFIVLSCALVSWQGGAPPRATPVTHVGISVRQKPADKLQVTIENLRDSPLLELSIALSAPGVGRRESHWYFDGYPGRLSTLPPRPGTGRVAPHERRVMEIDVTPTDERRVAGQDGPRTATEWAPAVALAVFADNHYEGSLDALVQWRERRQTEADELTYWIRAIDTMPRDSVDGARRHLEEYAVDRVGQNTGADTQLRVRMWRLAKDTQVALSILLRTVDRERAEADRQLSALRPSLVGDLVPRTVRSVSLASSAASGTTHVVAIENRGAAPLEAFSYEYLGADGKPRGGVSTDFCASPTGAEAGRGRLAPGEVREFPLRQDAKEGVPPVVRVKYALFEDLSFEGSPSDREAVFKEREQRADDAAYAIAVLRRAVTAPAQALAVLTAARAERARQLQEQGKRGSLGQLDEFIRQAKASPESLSARASILEADLEFQRQRCLRHLAR
jgi:hypothetical protein